MTIYRETLFDILECNSLYQAKELAAEALDVDVQEYIDVPSEADDYFESGDDDEDIDIDDILKKFN